MSTDTASSAASTSPVPGCETCAELFDPASNVVIETEHFVGYTNPSYPWRVMVASRRHDAAGPWSLTEAEGIEFGQLIPRITGAIKATGSERAYVLALGEDTTSQHFHAGFLSRYVKMSEDAHVVMYGRVTDSTEDPIEVARTFAAAVREQMLTDHDRHLETERTTIARYEATDGKNAGDGWLEGLPLVILTTKGRKTGEPRKVVLTRCLHEGVYAVVGSGPDPIGGTPTFSQWYHNLVADPNVTVRDGADEFQATARTANPQEKAEWWPRVCEVWPDYEMYQANTSKDIPVVLLERVQ